jgi:hypothetical protein
MFVCPLKIQEESELDIGLQEISAPKSLPRAAENLCPGLQKISKKIEKSQE